jgi:S-adenosyl-L-methionine hydrolase (adenosine-forming)
MTAIITLTTDFGAGSPYVAAMKGVMLGINPALRLIDLSHEVSPQDVTHGAVLLAETTTWFPAGTTHVAVVDPGVGTARRLLYARIGDQQYLAPDNGLLSLLAKRTRPVRMVELANSEYWLPAVSNTFHGRDILAPVAGQLSLGLEPERLGPIVSDLKMLDWPDPKAGDHRIDGAVRWIDHFGNLITNIPASMLAATEDSPSVRISCGGMQINGTIKSYGARQPGELTALIGSSGFLEIAAVNGSAANMLHVAAGAPVTIEASC